VYSFDRAEKNFRELKDKEIVLILVQSGSFVANNSNIVNNLKPVFVVYNAELNGFFSIDNHLPIIPFLSSYSLPGWELFNLNINYRHNLIEGFRNFGKANF